jgi:hypothetical protein
MKQAWLKSFCLVFGLICLLVGTASADTITYNFSTSGFGTSAPTDRVIGSVTVTFDPLVSSGGHVDDIHMSSFAGFTFTPGEVNFLHVASEIPSNGSTFFRGMTIEGTGKGALTFEDFLLPSALLLMVGFPALGHSWRKRQTRQRVAAWWGVSRATRKRKAVQ